MKKFKDSNFYKNTSRNLPSREIDIQKELGPLDKHMADVVDPAYRAMSNASKVSARSVFVG